MSFREPFDWYSKEGYLDAIREGSLTLYCYTRKTVQECNWNFHTTTARGLVLDDSGKIIARPFRKFFNLNERPETHPGVLPAEVPELSEKYDGSLIVAFWNPESARWQAVTMGSWDNRQTQYANQWLAGRSQNLDRNYTYLFELIAPWNRIVILYPEERMILIGVINTESGEDWSYTKVREFGLSVGFEPVRFEKKPFDGIDFHDAAIVGEEGYVARYSSGLRVKLKYAEYMRLHAILTELSVKDMWRYMSTGQPINVGNVPADFAEWFNAERSNILDAKKRIEDEARTAFEKAPNCGSRKEYASYFMTFRQPIRSILFLMLDGQPYEDILWEHVEPKGRKTFQTDIGG